MQTGAGEPELGILLASLSPRLGDEELVFCSFENARYGDRRDLAPVAAVTEGEGLTLVVPRSKADEQGLVYEAVFKRITLTVHSSLEAVGLTAAVATTLSEHGIAANVVAGFYHDHVFVRSEQGERAIAVLDVLARGQPPRADRESRRP